MPNESKLNDSERVYIGLHDLVSFLCDKTPIVLVPGLDDYAGKFSVNGDKLIFVNQATSELGINVGSSHLGLGSRSGSC
ncbi:uncharacterized protein DS421_6g189140 [Arachis hypogaea]|nr:uncharacterized protein DS421_6g189140 [Arachis hypogaea]